MRIPAPKEDAVSFENDVNKRIKKAGDIITSGASSEKKKKAHAAVALAGISNQVGPNLALQLLKLIDELIGVQ